MTNSSQAKLSQDFSPLAYVQASTKPTSTSNSNTPPNPYQMLRNATTLPAQ